ncbi:MAG: aminofutalosine synthase MqnE [Planctomycetes bacterium]|nr:aminofutalosine synthase MqnE [Planctomycetota bacterium]
MVQILERSDISEIVAKVEAGERLSHDDGVKLFNTRDLSALGYAANLVRERKNGDHAYYIINRHINYTNVCWDTCSFCAFARKPKQPGAYEFSLDEIFAKAEKLRGTRAGELHIVGGLHPSLPWEYYTEMLRGLKRILPDVSIKIFTAVEIDWLGRLTKKPVQQVLEELIECGMDSIPGGGAEIFHPEVRDEICPNKIDADRWLEIHGIAHRLGLKTGTTMLYGHIEKPEHRVDHILRIREQQDKTGGFMNFIPLSFHPDNSEMPEIPQASGITDIKCIAVARLLLDNVQHIKSYWVSSSLKLAQVALSYGADDLDGTIEEERIYHMAGAKTPQTTAEQRLREAIIEAGRKPCRRDTHYGVIE